MSTPYTPITLRPSLLTSQQNMDLHLPNQTHYASTQMTTTNSLNTQIYEDNPQASASTQSPQVSAQPRSYRVSTQFEPVERIIPQNYILNIPQPELVWRNDPIAPNYYHPQQNGFVMANEEILMSQLENAHQEENESLNAFAERVRKLLRKKNARYSYQMFNLAKNMGLAKIFKLIRDLLLLYSIYNDFHQLFKK